MYKTIKKLLIQNAVPPQKTYKVCRPAKRSLHQKPIRSAARQSGAFIKNL